MEAAGQDGGWVQTAGGIQVAPDPIRVDGERLALRIAPPMLGQHTEQVLMEAGYRPEEIDVLRAAGVIR
jgi:crotonobetainyl-CoA:carnitine CoA-transferase CaiB-like acyl-CoA transferase